MTFVKKNGLGILVCLAIALPSYFLGTLLPVVGGPVFAIVTGMVLGVIVKNKDYLRAGVGFTSKYILQAAVVMLGFGLNLGVIAAMGLQSLPIIVVTISVSLIIAFVVGKLANVPSNSAILVGVGSSICGGSAIAATAPVIKAKDDEVVQSISVIFFFNVIAAVLFPTLGTILGFDTTSGNAFGIFAGTAINDTSSVTAAAATWDSLWLLGSATLDTAVTVKLTRTLAIIPITFALAIYMAKKQGTENGEGFSLKRALPAFIILFICASIITTVATQLGVPSDAFTPLKDLSKFLIILAMAGVGLNSNIVQLVKTGAKPLALGLACWCGITISSLGMQYALGIW